MDIFNRKRVKKLEADKRRLFDKIHELKIEKITLENKAKKVEPSALIMQENQMLLKWIQNILDTFGTCDVRESHVSIPVYKREIVPYSEGNGMYGEFKEERIEIPAITIVKMR